MSFGSEEHGIQQLNKWKLLATCFGKAVAKLLSLKQWTSFCYKILCSTGEGNIVAAGICSMGLDCSQLPVCSKGFGCSVVASQVLLKPNWKKNHLIMMVSCTGPSDYLSNMVN